MTEFDPARLQDGLLMAVENVHEKLRVAREKQPVMVGNPIMETPAQNVDMAGVTALGRDLAAARERAYGAVDKIDWPDGFCRRDIGVPRPHG